MIHVLHALLLQTQLRSKPTGIDQVKSFLRAAHTGREGSVLPPYQEQGEPTKNDRPVGVKEIREYSFRFARIGVSTRTGRVVFFSGGYPYTDYPAVFGPDDGTDNLPVLPRALNDTEAASIAARTHAAAGFEGGIWVLDITDLMGANSTCVQVAYYPAWGGVPYEGFENHIDLNRQTGRLEGFFAYDDLPRPPRSLSPGGTPDQARLVALRAASSWRGGNTYQEVPKNPFHLSLWYVRPSEMPGPGTFASAQKVVSLGGGHLADLRAGRAILAYSGSLIGSDGKGFLVHLDARTGNVLHMELPDLRGAGGLAPKTALLPVVVPSAPRPWRVATDAKGWRVWSAPANEILAGTAAKPPAKGTRLSLTDGKTGFSATYDAGSNLLGIDGKAYRPGPALATLLRRKPKAPGR